MSAGPRNSTRSAPFAILMPIVGKRPQFFAVGTLLAVGAPVVTILPAEAPQSAAGAFLAILAPIMATDQAFQVHVLSVTTKASFILLLPSALRRGNEP